MTSIHFLLLLLLSNTVLSSNLFINGNNGACVSQNYVLDINNHFSELTDAVKLMALNVLRRN